VVALNRIVAVRELRGPEEALRQLVALPAGGPLEHYHLYHGVRGELLAALGRTVAARAAFREALEYARATPVRQFLRARMESLPEADVDSGTPRPS
jgi:RNA polymerase sigma-70 factor (ECF subfamily)